MLRFCGSLLAKKGGYIT